MTLPYRHWRLRLSAIQLPSLRSLQWFLWLLCGNPLLHIILFPLILDDPRAFQGFLVQSLRPIASLGALSVVVYVFFRYQGKRRWAWACVAVALFFNMVFSIDRIVAGTAAPTPLTKTLPLLIYLFFLIATALYIDTHDWLIGSTRRAVLGGVVVGFASLVLMRSGLPPLLRSWPWNPEVGIVLPYLALDMGIFFAVGAGGSRFGRNNRSFVALILLSLLCLLIADGFYLWLAWAPWGPGKHWLLQPLFSFQVILLAFAAYRDLSSQMTPVQQVPMPLREWIFWALVPECFLLSAFLVASLTGTIAPLMGFILFGAALGYALLSELDHRHVQNNLFNAMEQVSQAKRELAITNADLARANRQLEDVNRDLATAHAAAAQAAATSEAFIARIIHDLAPPMQGLNSVIIGSHWRADQQIERDVAHRQLRLLEHFVHQARTYLQARTVTIHCSRLHLLPLCRASLSTVALRARQRDIQILQEIEIEAPTVWGEETAILRILDNLLTNALGVTPDGGTVIMRVAAPAPQWIEIAIIDQGPGIPCEKQAMLFQPYHSIQMGADQQMSLAPSPTGTGMGLGLAIVKELTSALGGQCGVQSDLGAGSLFFIRLATEEPHNGEEVPHSTNYSGS